MNNPRNIVGTWFGIFALMAIVIGGLDHAGRADPSGHESAYRAVHGIVIPPFQG